MQKFSFVKKTELEDAKKERRKAVPSFSVICEYKTIKYLVKTLFLTDDYKLVNWEI